MISQTLQNSHELYRRTHEAYPDNFKGNSLLAHVTDIAKLVQNSNIHSCLDYGCGKAAPWKNGIRLSIPGLKKVFLYDPGVKEYSGRLERKVDLVVAIDVLEHVPEEVVDEVLADINSYATKAIYLAISTRPASKTLVDGSNAHATVKPKEWWQEKINKLEKYVVVHYTT